MEQLKQSIKEMIEEYFDKKVENVNWYNDMSMKKQVAEVVRETIENVLYELKDADLSIDTLLETLNYEHERERKFERVLVMDDMRTQDEMEADLWN